MIRQLIVQGYLRSEQRRYGALMLTAASRPLLKGEVALQLREDPRTNASTKKPRSSKTPLAAGDRPLFEALRERRRELAEQQNLPAYVIFHDATLAQMAQLRPQTSAELLDISGVGQAKLDRYGEQFLAVIRAA